MNEIQSTSRLALKGMTDQLALCGIVIGMNIAFMMAIWIFDGLNVAMIPVVAIIVAFSVLIRRIRQDALLSFDLAVGSTRSPDDATSHLELGDR